jgi:hypothetical protein
MSLVALFLSFSLIAPIIAQSCSKVTPPSTHSNAKLPDPFTFISGRKVSSQADWTCRRSEIKDLLAHYELGPKPSKGSYNISASLSTNQLSITASQSGRTISFSASVRYPTTGTAPYPALIVVQSLTIPVPPEVAIITLNVETLAPSDPPTAAANSSPSSAPPIPPVASPPGHGAYQP